MLSSIHPLGERTRGNRWGTTATYYVVGSTLGGALMGAALGVIGAGVASLWSISDSFAVWSVIAVLIVSALLDLWHVPVPSLERQVDETWLNRYRTWVYGGGFGFQLGTGVMTFVKTASIYALWLLVVLGGSPVGGLIVGAWFGLVRASALLTVGGIRDPAALRSYFRRMAKLGPAANAVAVVGPIAAALVVLLGWVRP
ncbi:MAG: hypothetical protein WD184_02615 [Acidimicrobiia bacterium]